MLGKKSIYRRPAVILGSLVLLMLLNLVVVNNPMFATRISDLGSKTEQVSEMTPEESNAQLAAMADAIVAEQQKSAELGQQIQNLDKRVTTLENKNVKAHATKEEVKEMSTKERLSEGLHNFWLLTGFRNCKLGNIIMILVGILFIFLAIRFEFEPMLLIPIGTGIIVGNIPFFQGFGVTFADAMANLQALDPATLNFDLDTAKALLVAVFGDNPGDKHMVLSEAIKSVEHLNMADYGLVNNDIEGVKGLMTSVFQSGELNLQTGLYQKGSVLNYLYFGVTSGVYPPLIFLGIGAMTDFSSLIANPKLMILGAAAQLGVFITFIGALYLGFNLREAGAIGIIGGADGPTAIFLSSRLANGMNGTPVIQPPIIRLLTTKEERLIKMGAPRMVNKTEKIMFPIVGLILTTFISPTALPLLGMLFFGNIIKESGVVKRLQNTASNPLIDIVTIVLGLTVGASTQASVFLTSSSIKIFVLGAASFCVATAGGLLGAKLMNLFLKEKINPMIGAAGVSAVPDSARVVEVEGQKYDPSNHLLMHAMAPNVSGVIGSAVAAGVMMSFLMM